MSANKPPWFWMQTRCKHESFCPLYPWWQVNWRKRRGSYISFFPMHASPPLYDINDSTYIREGSLMHYVRNIDLDIWTPSPFLVLNSSINWFSVSVSDLDWWKWFMTDPQLIPTLNASNVQRSSCLPFKNQPPPTFRHSQSIRRDSDKSQTPDWSWSCIVYWPERIMNLLIRRVFLTHSGE